MDAASLLRLAKREAAWETTSFEQFAMLTEVDLTPAQHEFVRVGFDGQPAGTTAEAQQLWGDVEILPGLSRGVFVAVCGARSGKSLLGGLRTLHLAATLPLDILGRGEVAICPIVAPDLKTARQTLRFAEGHARELFGDAITDNSADGFTLVRPSGRKVRIEVRAASAGGKSIRGNSMPCCVLDESAFFRDATYKINDQEIYEAVSPRIMPGGQLLILSTPWAEIGLLWETWRTNYGKPTTALVAHAPTELMRRGGPAYDDVMVQIERERKRDPVNARREFDAEFMSKDAAMFFDPRAIDAAIDDSLNGDVPRRLGANIEFGGDLGFRHDSSALVGCQYDNGPFEVCLVDEVVPSDSPLVPSEVFDRFAATIRRYEGEGMVADAHYRESIREHLDDAGLDLFFAPEGQKGKAQAYQVARVLFLQGKVRIPRHERLIRQLRETMVRPTPGGGISIQNPRWKTGGHGDLVSALVLCLWRAARYYKQPEKPQPKEGTREFARLELERRMEAKRRKIEKRERMSIFEEFENS